MSQEMQIIGLTVYAPSGEVSYRGEQVKECGITPHGVPFVTVSPGPGKILRYIGVAHVIEMLEPGAVQVVGALPQKLRTS